MPPDQMARQIIHALICRGALESRSIVAGAHSLNPTCLSSGAHILIVPLDMGFRDRPQGVRPQNDFTDHAESAPGSDEEPLHVVPGHVFHGSAAALADPAV